MSDFIRINTPESVDLAFEPVGLGSRFIAALIDSLIQFAITLAILAVLAVTTGLSEIGLDTAENIGVAILMLAIALLYACYKLLFEAVWNGQTPGKRLTGIRVVRSNGLPVTFIQVLIRNLMRIVDFLPSWYVLGSLCVLASRHNQRLGDMAAGTVVVRDRKAAVPTVPTVLNRAPTCDLNVLREHSRRLSEADLNPARSFLERRNQLEGAHRTRVAQHIALSLATRMGWQEEITHPELFLEDVLHVRAQ